MADRAFINQPQSDGSAAEAAKHVITTNVEVPAGPASDPPANGAACAGPYYPGNAKEIILVATAACEFWVRGSGSTGGAALTTMRELAISGATVAASATKVGVINGDTIPGEFFLWDTSASTNDVTMHWIY